MTQRLGVLFGIGGVTQLLTLYMLVMTTLGQRQLATRSYMYFSLTKFAAVVWRLYAGLTVAFVGFMIYTIFYDGRNPSIICAMVVATGAGFGYAAVGSYKDGRKGDAVIRAGFGLSFIGYSGMLVGPLGLRMTAAVLMMVGAVGGVLGALFIPLPEEEPLDARRA